MRTVRLWLSVFVMVLLAAAAAGCSSSKSATPSVTEPADATMPWPAPADPMARARAAGLQPLKAEALAYHVHSHLDVFKDGRPIVVPAYIGIDAQSRCDKPCISPLHTHDTTGVVHIESPHAGDFTLAQFLTEWGVTLEPSAAIFVNGTRVSGGPAAVVLRDGEEIAVVVGAPPPTVPSSFAGV